MPDQLGRCFEHLRKAVAHMAVSPGTPQEKLRGMVAASGYGSIAEGDFPNGQLRDDFKNITGQLSRGTEPQFMSSIASMSNERARRVIEEIVKLSQAVAFALGGQSNSA